MSLPDFANDPAVKGLHVNARRLTAESTRPATVGGGGSTHGQSPSGSSLVSGVLKLGLFAALIMGVRALLVNMETEKKDH
jgi:hypothetical protein